MSEKTPGRTRDSGLLTSLTVTLQPDQLSAIDGWRRQQPDKPGRAAALAILAAKALTTKGAH